ncbi:hypothetical protein KUV57_12795 [Epibacterium sp. DP7N7-1]|nr:hypothetical protein [Epibacterium sp. DP7N7-1]
MMNAKEKWVAEQTATLRARQAELIAQGTPDEVIPMQIAQLGYLWDITHQGRKFASTPGFSTYFIKPRKPLHTKSTSEGL